MVNGPPTPPATTPAELQDEARTAASSIAASSAPTVQNVPQNRPDIYQSVIPLMAEAIARNDYQRLVRIADDADRSSVNDRQQSRFLIVAPLVLGHLVLDEVTPARYALIRLPDNLASHPLSRALTGLVTSTINRQHTVVHDQAAALQNLVSQPDFIDKDLASVIVTLLSAFIDYFRRRTFALLSKAYTSLPLSLACTYLNIGPDQIIIVAQEHSWSYDPSAQILIPSAGLKAQGASITSGESFEEPRKSILTLVCQVSLP
ncbi:hypothetical protein GALMADRAFT_239914 [Galerina marginata CBS 339.88]|uniref:CSN8/PSMD8/EIF3K domain-containing protein n=1 Tax=Galerina marginata (strain CBS 339.88) TaxID=685588 RepID=A0A067TEZ2_GALM3|nr:hypothetical protein GALMADRAFT_239914 [Galerina marginata CBS 339.88]